MQVSRFDNNAISLTERVGANGYLNLPAVLTRAGVFSYRQADGSTIKELRHPDEVFKPSSLGTLKHVPLITEQDHLRCVTDDVPVNQVSEFTSLGVVGDRLDRNDQDEVEGNVTAYRPETIKKIDTGAEAQLSAGYTTDIVSEAGTYKGEAYDQKQTNIIYGHVAVVRRGRAGSARFRVDSTAAILSTETKTKKEDSVTTIIKKEIPAITVGTGENSFRLDSLTVEESPGVLSVLARESVLIGKCEKALTRADFAEGERDQLKTAKEKLETELKDAIPASRLDAEIEESVLLVGMCGERGIDHKGKTNLERKRAICLKENPGLDAKRLDGDYLEGVFDPIRVDRAQKAKELKTVQGLENSLTDTGDKTKISYKAKT